MIRLQLLFAFVLGSNLAYTQSITWEYLTPLPEKITNNAVTSVTTDTDTYLYTFAGMDTTLDCNGDHLRAYRYVLSADEWLPIADLPDPNGGKIAAAASVIKDRVYVVGGYHLAPDCSEVSSDRIHIFDPLTNEYVADGAAIPVAIDDQVQAVWRDSLLYVITGWSNTTNVNNVQVYNPSNDSWQQATPVDNGIEWRVFGGSGVIIGDTIYYAGGARPSFNFPASTYFRKGYINPDNPYDITWEGYTEPLATGYRMGAATFNGQAIWIGGSGTTYNFDALAYNGSGVVQPWDRIGLYDPISGELAEVLGFIPSIMDLRGVAELGDGQYLLAGGMLTDQQVTDQLLKITISDLTDTSIPLPTGGQLTYYPNPTQDRVHFDFHESEKSSFRWTLLDEKGTVLLMGSGSTDAPGQVSLVALPAGAYWIQIRWEDGAGAVLAVQKL